MTDKIMYNPKDYPIHVQVGVPSNNARNAHLYLCGDKLQYTPSMDMLHQSLKWLDVNYNGWHELRPLCPKCHAKHIALTGEAIEWPHK